MYFGGGNFVLGVRVWEGFGRVFFGFIFSEDSFFILDRIFVSISFRFFRILDCFSRKYLGIGIFSFVFRVIRGKEG